LKNTNLRFSKIFKKFGEMAVGGDVVAQEDYRLLLGYPDEKISEKYRIDFSTSKIGGLPVRICYYINSFWD
jgi:hypothetical protein